MIVDASVLVAAANVADPDSAACQSLLRANANRSLVVPAAALAEACYLVQKRIGPHAEILLVESLTVAPWRVDGPADNDLPRAVELMRQYVDLPLGVSDALTVALAERLGDTAVASLDAHFRIVRPRHTNAFDVAP